MKGCRICSKLDSCYDCNPGFKLTETNTCEGCPQGCSTCANTTGNCTGCLDKFYLDTTSKTCKACGLRCQTCDVAGDANCKTCVANAALPTGKTLGACSCISGYIADSTGGCVKGTASSSAAYVFTGLLTLIVLLVAIF
jgi:hypothetical protein